MFLCEIITVNLKICNLSILLLLKTMIQLHCLLFRTELMQLSSNNKQIAPKCGGKKTNMELRRVQHICSCGHRKSLNTVSECKVHASLDRQTRLKFLCQKKKSMQKYWNLNSSSTSSEMCLLNKCLQSYLPYKMCPAMTAVKARLNELIKAYHVFHMMSLSGVELKSICLY